ncbi:esterase/lipase family protein [Spirillospora sp. NPDC127200]
MLTHLSGLSPRRRLLVLGALALVAVLVTAVVARVALGRDGGGPPARQDRPGPVLLVPGYGGGTGGLVELADRLRSVGRAAEVVAMPSGGTGDLREQAKVLDRRVALELREGAPSVDVVGYSAGGVVARLWAREHDGASKARRVVTLGSPHAGADVAAAGSALAPGACPTACRQLAPGSPLLRDLGARAPVPPVWVSLWTTHDETVRPESSRLAGALNIGLQEVCRDAATTHGGLPTDPVVAGIVLRSLGTDPPAAPRPADCHTLRTAS